ncbi:saccharopine dehydrogenase NADP-binding domain-containing protein [Rhizobiales bacterium]|uniref:saccharopine dehydrogenase family protein n=1 Tax=Hongsoonwoonella zoysiae TaxID=2821844 RepID=UPI00155FB2C1|nr:saccharopine dehydrogenase NADP-binding domain-containing protein [Hongsoonwoonella zoysiae]NRG19288.1 saccharopine dehydrogenase NADP-binding domain-containing protein [Hongsoonwoonella zoysiae]
MTAWPVLIVGAGKIGRMIASLLTATGDYEVTIADRDALALAAATRPGITTITVDVSNEDALVKVLQGKKAVLSAAPFFLTETIANAAKRAGAHYLDLTEDVASTKAVKALAKNSQTAFAPQCGLAPGFVSIAGHDLAVRFDDLDSLTLRVGALPRYPTNAIKYNLTWSTDGLINEYCNACEAIVDGEPTMVQPLEGYETFSLEGVDYEAFNTSGGLGSLAETLSGKVRSLRYLTVRYPGHRDIMRLLLQDLGLRDRRDLMRDVLETAVPVTRQDVVLVFITASGTIGGSCEQISAIYRVTAKEIAGELWSAIQTTTSAGICATLDMIRDGSLAAKGFIRQEGIPLARFLQNRFGSHFAPENEGKSPAGERKPLVAA